MLTCVDLYRHVLKLVLVFGGLLGSLRAMSKRKRSSVWTYFDDSDGTDATCVLCKDIVKTSGNTSNAMKHLKSKHQEEYQLVHAQQEESKRLRLEQRQSSAEQSKQVSLETTLERSRVYPRESTRCKKLDESLVRMLAVDLQPASIVEDRGFLTILHSLDPKYQPPSRRSIMRSTLPNLYQRVKVEVKAKLASTKHCALTTDLWTSRTTQGYITVTCHFISSNWELHSAVLDTLLVDTDHTAENLATELTSVTNEWEITDKIVCVVTDNASNIVAAVRLNGWKHMPCFAHTLNLIVQDSINGDSQLTEIQKKCRNIVSYFHRSSKATNKLLTIQNRLKLEPHKLVQDVETRWNSLFYMFERMIEQHEAVTTTLCLLDKSNLCLSVEEIEAMKNAVTLLKPYEAATREMSADQYLTISKVIPLARSLQQLTAGAINSQLCDGLCLQMRRRFLNMESNQTLAASTLLDPRLKKVAFADGGAADQGARRLTSEMTSESSNTSMEEPNMSSGITQNSKEARSCGLWHAFDQQVAEMSNKRTPTTDAMVETHQYLQQRNIGRKEDSLSWWQQNGSHYPQLALLAMKYLCIPSTSVPAERLFSKAGELVSARRSRLKPKHVNMYLFLNKNL